MLQARLFLIATSPGIVAHELAHQLSCNLLGVPVVRCSYFNFRHFLRDEDMAIGYVIHNQPRKMLHALLIALSPLIVNSLLSLSFAYLAVITRGPLTYGALYSWLAIAFGIHAFPSNQDAENVLNYARSSSPSGKASLNLGISILVVWLVRLLNRSRRYQGDVLYSLYLFFLVMLWGGSDRITG